MDAKFKKKYPMVARIMAASEVVEDIPPEFPVQPIGPEDEAKDPVTCGHCHLTWDDAIPTSYTPAPSGRCPFEHFHIHDD